MKTKVSTDNAPKADHILSQGIASNGVKKLSLGESTEKSVVAKKMKNVAKRLPPIRRLLDENRDLKISRGILQLEKGNLEADVRELSQTIENARIYLAQRYIKGRGIEIGPTYLPVKLPKAAKVKYLDEAPLEELYKRYPELKKLDMAPIHIVDNAEKLSKIKNRSLDFIIANHFLEHTLDPIGTIINMHNKLRNRGVLFFAIPDKRYTFDIKRPITPYKHLLDEHHAPTQEMKYRHFLEVSEYLGGLKGNLKTAKGRQRVKKRADELFENNFSIHYHVWTRPGLIEFFYNTIDRYELPLEIVAVLDNNPEAIFVLRKNDK